MQDEQDMRRMGGLRKYLPKTHSTMVAAWLAICGIIPLSGFFSKDEILWHTFGSSIVLYLIGLTAAFLTAFYMTRLMALTFWQEEKFRGSVEGLHLKPHESPPIMWVPLAILAVFSVAAGWVGIPHALGGHNFFAEWLRPVMLDLNAGAPDSHAPIGLELGLMVVSLLVAVSGILLARWVYLRRPEMAERAAEFLGGVPYRLSLNKYFVDEAYAVFPIGALLRLSRSLMRFDARGVDGMPNGSARFSQLLSQASAWFDRYVVDLLVNLQGWLVRGGSVVLRSAQTGFVQNYALFMVVGLIAFFVVYLVIAS